MGLPNDSILVTPGFGATVATQLISSKEYQVIVNADEFGQILGSRDTYCIDIPEQVHVAAANTKHWDLFNAHDTFLVRVISILQRPSIVTAVAGIAFAWTLRRTTDVGTGGSALTPWLPDTSQAALNAAITARSKPTGGATDSTLLKSYSIHSEETNVGVIAIASIGGLELVPLGLFVPNSEHGILLRQNQGLEVIQVTNSAAGNTGWGIIFTVE